VGLAVALSVLGLPATAMATPGDTDTTSNVSATAGYGTSLAPGITTDTGNAAPGIGVTLDLFNFCANTTISILVDGTTIGSVVTDASGKATFFVAGSFLPKGIANHTITSTGVVGGTCVETASLAPAAPTPTLGPAAQAASGGARLPTTGQNSLSSLRTAVVLVAIGALVMFVASTRRRHRVDRLDALRQL